MEEYLRDKLDNLLKAIDVNYNHIDIQEGLNLDKKEQFLINIQSPEASLLIGKKGNNIIALQHLLKQLVRDKFPDLRLSLDVDSYKKRQIENALGVTERHINKVREQKKAVALPPMSPYYRRVVHIFVDRNFKDIKTESAGFQDNRHIVLKPNN